MSTVRQRATRFDTTIIGLLTTMTSVIVRPCDRYVMVPTGKLSQVTILQAVNSCQKFSTCESTDTLAFLSVLLIFNQGCLSIVPGVELADSSFEECNDV